MRTRSLGDPRRRLRTSAWKKRARARFWTEHAERLRLVLIGGTVVIAAGLVAEVALR
ncbi:MAG TPA: hypothetical protein VHV27_09295 [Phenylobacterium sp.]|jgi:hypothetical protein|nr:hypothetical protein [Phenylobacterium sp.]